MEPDAAAALAAAAAAAAAAPAPAPAPGPAPAPPPAAAAAAAAAPPVKRRRGRPRKSELPPGGAPAAKPMIDPSKPKKTRKRKGEAAGAAATSVDVSMIGQQVTGVLDGTFDAGYLLTVRVGASDTILRGVVFSPGLSVPISRVNDVAPGVKHVRREDRAMGPPKLPISAKPPQPLPLAVKLPVRPFATPASLPPASQIPPTQAVLENAAALFTHAVTATPPPPSSAPPPPNAAVTGLVAALQQLPGGGYTPDASTFSQSTFQSI